MTDRQSKNQGFSTRAIHHAYDPYAGHGSLNPPVYLSSTYTFPTIADGAARFAGEQAGFVYSRVGNPTTALLEERIANLEGGEAALVTASGQGATTSLLWTLLQPGDEVIADQTLYGCTYAFFHKGLEKYGVSIKHVDLSDPKNLERALTPATRLVFFESPANPNMRLVDIAAIAAIARQHKIWSVIDNTYCTPYLQRPLEFGADFVIHSATKYLGGHGDLLAGAIVGPKAILDEVRSVGIKDLTGAVLSSQDAFLVLRGLKTLALRMERHSASAQRLAEYLEAHPKVAIVRYPGLKSFAQFDLAQRQMRLPGGMIAFELKAGIEAGICFMDQLQLFTRAVSLGDAESLAQHPASMTHAVYTPEERAEHQISDGLIRLSVGLEDVEDLLADLDQALQ